MTFPTFITFLQTCQKENKINSNALIDFHSSSFFPFIQIRIKIIFSSDSFQTIKSINAHLDRETTPVPSQKFARSSTIFVYF